MNRINLQTGNMISCALFSALIVVGAFIRIPLPLIPFTLQFLFTTLAGLMLGGRLAALSVMLYIGMGLIGLPVFAEGGGIAYVFKPSFGYLIGFAFAAYVTGMLAARQPEPGYARLLGASLIGLLIVYVCGMTYCYLISRFFLGSPIGFWTLFLYCFVLAVPGDIMLCWVAAGVARRLRPWFRPVG